MQTGFLKVSFMLFIILGLITLSKSKNWVLMLKMEQWREKVFTGFCSVPELANQVPPSLPQANLDVHYSPGRVLTHIQR